MNYNSARILCSLLLKYLSRNNLAYNNFAFILNENSSLLKIYVYLYVLLIQNTKTTGNHLMKFVHKVSGTL